MNRAQEHAQRIELRDRTIAMLNDLTELDPDAMHLLAETRAEVNKEMQDAQTPATEAVILLTDPGQPVRLGVIGLINGILGLEYRIVGQYNDAGKLVGWGTFDPKPLEKRGG